MQNQGACQDRAGQRAAPHFINAGDRLIEEAMPASDGAVKLEELTDSVGRLYDVG